MDILQWIYDNMAEERVEFTTIREDFSEYEVENGEILRVKFVLTEIINRTNGDKETGGGIRFSTISKISALAPIDTSNLELISDPSQVTKKDEVKELKFKPTKEIVNIYETTNSLILAIPHMTKIFLTNKKDQNNLPHLRFSLVADVTITEKTPPPRAPKF